jgi:hypothetical protein
MRRRGFACEFEVADQEDERGYSEGDPADEMEAVHESEKASLAFELVVEVCAGGVCGVGGREAVLLEVGRCGVNGLLKLAG